MSNLSNPMDFHLPEIGEGVYEAELVRWLVKPGDLVKHGQSLMEVMTDKATMEVPSPFAGAISALKAEPGQQLKVGVTVLVYSEPDGEASRRKDGAAEQPSSRPESVVAPPRVSAAPTSVKAAPSVRQMARKLGIDLAQVHGSGPGGRVVVEDLAKHLPTPTTGTESPRSRPDQRPDFGTPGTRIKLLGMRRKIAEHMVQAARTIPQYAYIDECEVSDLVRLRESLREPLTRQGVKLTYLSFFVKAAAEALKEVPLVNASLDEKTSEIVLHATYHVGVAVATPAGLIVPVVRDADRKDLVQIARDIERLSSEARAGKSRLEDLRGSTFTITSIGGIGGLISTPVINHPEVAILGIGRVVKRPVFDANGQVRPADILYLSFAFDHRVVDGAVGAAFGNALSRRVQKPAALLLPSLNP